MVSALREVADETAAGTPYMAEAASAAELVVSLVMVQMRTDLSRDEETIMSMLSIGVGMAVTTLLEKMNRRTTRGGALRADPVSQHHLGR